MIRTLMAAEATERLRAEGIRISPETIRAGLQQKVFPFGDCVMVDGKPKWCYVYASMLESWRKKRKAEQ